MQKKTKERAMTSFAVGQTGLVVVMALGAWIFLGQFTTSVVAEVGLAAFIISGAVLLSRVLEDDRRRDADTPGE